MKEALLDAVRTHPYLAMLAGFVVTVAYGLTKLAAMLQTLQAS